MSLIKPLYKIQNSAYSSSFSSFNLKANQSVCREFRNSKTPNLKHFNYGGRGKIRILSIDTTKDVMPAAAALARLESGLRSLSGNPTLTIADFFDAAAGSGNGGILAAMLFTKTPFESKPLFSAEEAFAFLTKNKTFRGGKSGLIGLFSKKSSNRKVCKMFKNEVTLKDTIKPLLIPCYDMVTGSPFVFSRSDAVESDAFNFKMNDVCGATCAERAVRMESIDGRTRIAAIGNGAVMSNPTAAVITHVLNNKTEFPFVNGVEDLLVLSVGNGSEETSVSLATPSRREMIRIAGNFAAETVDQSVATAFRHGASNNYVRIQANQMSNAEDIFMQNNVESVLFSGKRISILTNAEKLDLFGKNLVREEERRKLSPIPVVMVKQHATKAPSRCSCSTNASLSSTSSDSC